jgi:glutamyl-tRNA synthetase
VESKTIRKYALQNAVLHGGKADAKAVLGKVLAEDPSLKSRIKEVSEGIRAAVEDVNKLAPELQRSELEKLAPELLEKPKEEKQTELPPLPKVNKKVVMRLAPYPSGPLHIGNARMVLLNDEYVKRYEGTLILMFDDTIGSEDKYILPEAYDQIKQDLEWLGVKYDEVLYKSDRLPLFYEWADKLIRKGHAYVCECSYAKLRDLREKGLECEHRSREAKENLEKWREMVRGGFKEGAAVLRLRTRMDHPDPAFRDRVLLRVSDKEHPRVGRKFHVWPLLEFSWAVDDYLLGVSHVLRGKDLAIEDEMEMAVWDKLGIRRRPEFIHYGMLFFREMELSKSKYRKAIQEGRISGVDDPRTWTLQSLKRRGIRAEAVRSFILSFGLSLTDVEVPADNLYAENRRLIDPVAMRYFFVPSPVKIEIGGMPAIGEAHIPVHPDFPEKGRRTLRVAPQVYVSSEDFENLKGSEIRLKDLCNIKLGERSTFLSREVRDIPKIQWLAEGVPMKVVMPDGSVIDGLGENALLEAHVDDIVQLERFGFVRLDSIVPELKAYFAHR